MNAQNQKKQKKAFSKPQSIRITTTALLCAIAVLLQYAEVPLPFMPAFIKLDFSDLPELIGAFVCGPLAGVLIALIKNIFHLIASGSGAVGELSNFLLGAVFVFSAGMIYKKMPNFKGVIIGGIAGAVLMGIASLPLNNFIIYPLYYSVIGFPKEAILDMYRVIRPSTGSIPEALLVFNVPFTIVKGLISVLVSIIIYKPLSPILHNRKKQPTDKTAENE